MKSNVVVEISWLHYCLKRVPSIKTGVTGKFAWNNSSLYRKQTCWKDLKSEAARTKIKYYNQSKLTISQLTGLKTAILGH